MRRQNHLSAAAWLLCLAIAAWPAAAQSDADANPPPEAPGPAGATVKLNFPESFPLKMFIDYMGERYGTNYIYDQTVASRLVTVKAPSPIPVDSVPTLFESLLAISGFALVPTEVPGTVRIEQVGELSTVALPPSASDAPGVRGRPAVAVTRIFELRHISAKQLEPIVTRYVGQSRASFVPLPGQNLVVVTDFATNMRRIEELIAMVDRPQREVATVFVPIANLDVEELVKQVQELRQGLTRARGVVAGETDPVTILADKRTNQAIIIALPGEAEEVAELVRSLDRSLGLETRVYAFTVASPDHVDSLVKKLIGELAAKRLYKSAVDDEAQLLIATTTPEIHQQIDVLRTSLEAERPPERSPIRFYKLENAKAADVLATLRDIEGQQGLESLTFDGVRAEEQPAEQESYRGPTPEQVNPTARERAGLAALPPSRAEGAVQLTNARILADEATNSLIVIAKPSVHPMYERLIHRLDVRRPQVQIEATVVAIDTTDGFSLGVEILTDAQGDRASTLNFTQFGLSEFDADAGAMTLTPGIGFNGIVLSADIADLVIRALETDSRAKVISKPSVLVNDNATGTLTSENEEPYATVNASGVAGATTSFGGFAAAGTTITVTPQISEGDHLKLEYDIELSSFLDTVTDAGTGADAASLPPARQTNSLASEATIPDGTTIIVGGLTRETKQENIDRVPILGRIPVLEYLFSNRSVTERKTTLFVFIRAVILRDDQFKQLKYLSRDAAGKAEIAGDHPTSEPVAIP